MNDVLAAWLEYTIISLSERSSNVVIRVSGTNKITSETSFRLIVILMSEIGRKSVAIAANKWRWFLDKWRERRRNIKQGKESDDGIAMINEIESVGANLYGLEVPPPLARKAMDFPRLSLSANPRSLFDSSDLFVSSNETLLQFLLNESLHRLLCRCQPIMTILYKE